MIRAVLVDDEPLARRGVHQLLAAHPDVAVVGEAADGHAAVALLTRLAPDLVFLDVQMPELDGFGVMRRVAAWSAADGGPLPLAVFLTAYDEFALDAFDVDALDYLVKPVAEARFAATLRRVRRRLAAPPPPPPAPHAWAAGERTDHLLVTSGRDTHVVPVTEIDWVGAEDYCVAVYAGGRRFLLRTSMGELEARLGAGTAAGAAPAAFVRVHRGALVNVGRVRQLRVAGGRLVVVLHDGTRVPVSRRRRGALREALGRVLGGERP